MNMRIIGVLGAVAIVGCVGDPVDGTRSGLLALQAAPTALETIETTRWELAPAGCEDQLGTSELTFAVAYGAHGLVAAINREGDVVCVDSLAAVQSELEAQGRSEEARQLAGDYVDATTAVETEDLRHDPTPQPSDQADPGEPGDDHGIDNGDPSPQPS